MVPLSKTDCAVGIESALEIFVDVFLWSVDKFVDAVILPEELLPNVEPNSAYIVEL